MSYPELKIDGRSGCFLELINFDKKIVVRKTASEKFYSTRLIKQAAKQHQFNSKKISPGVFKSPAVFKIADPDKEELYWFEMEYIPGDSYLSYIEKCSVSMLGKLADSLIEFIENEINLSQMKVIPGRVTSDKLDEITKKLRANKVLSTSIEKLLSELNASSSELRLPIGLCHGDLTFSNMIFNNKNIYLVDFLDSFIESPLLDIVKIRQDTKFNWSLYIDRNKSSFQSGKIIQAFRYLDKRIHEHFLKYGFYKDHYDFFEKINLLRVLPYLNNKDEINFITGFLNSTES